MRRTVVAALIFLAGSYVVAAPAPFAQGRPERGPTAGQLLENRRAQIAFVRPGMTRKQVDDILGHPSAAFWSNKGGGFHSYHDLGISVTFTLEGVVKEVRRHATR
jgi:hypothetical protein